MQMEQALAERSNPQTAIPIPKQPLWSELSRYAWERVCLGFPAGETPEAAGRGDKQPVAFVDKGLDVVTFAGHGMKLRRTRCPTPGSVHHAQPNRSAAVFVQTGYRVAEASSAPVALDVAPNGAELRIANRDCAGPNRAFTILEEHVDVMAGELRELSQCSVLPSCHSLRSSDPETPVSRGEQAVNVGGRQTLTRRWFPGDVSDAIEAKQPEIRTEP